ncbi:MAG: DR2241 family protein [Verrucomicrobiota bacterium]
MKSYRKVFRDWLRETEGPWRIGQLRVLPADKGYTLCHVEDVSQLSTLQPVADQEAWRQLLFFDDKGDFRPLKAAPNFPHGWVFGPLGFDQLVLALQFAYPAALAEWAAHRGGHLRVTPWQETAERQTGRFKIVAKLNGEQREELVRGNCAVACSKHRLWEPGASLANPPLPNDPARLPLLCPEACNYLVGKAREILKGPMD